MPSDNDTDLRTVLVSLGKLEATTTMVLQAVQDQKNDTAELRTRMHDEHSAIRSEMHEETDKFQTRFAQLERFQHKLAVIGGLIMLVILPAARWLVTSFFEKIAGG